MSINMVSSFTLHMGIFQRSMCGVCVCELFVSVYVYLGEYFLRNHRVVDSISEFGNLTTNRYTGLCCTP